jgi:hypothetical protein
MAAHHRFLKQIQGLTINITYDHNARIYETKIMAKETPDISI